MATRERIKLALVGCGNIARAHWRGIRRHAKRIEVTAVVDPDPDRAAAFAARTESRAFSSLEQALRDGDFEAVDLMLPHDLHEEAAVACFAAGKHVVLEKPMAPDLAACERILGAAARAGTVFLVAEQSQYWPDVVMVKEQIEAGAIGEVLTARASYVDRVPHDPEDLHPWRSRLDRAGGGICIDGGAHWIRPLRMWLGEIEEVLAVTGNHIESMEGETWARALFRFDSGATAGFEAALIDGPVAAGEDFRVTGSRGEFVIGGGREGRLELFDPNHPGGRVLMEAFPGKVDSYGYELEDFSRAVLEGRPLAAPAEESLGELRTALAIYRSARNRSWEKVW